MKPRSMKGVPDYEADGHPGYGEMLVWARGKCFRDVGAMKAAYLAETGKTVP